MASGVLPSSDTDAHVQQTLAVAREQLDMDLAWLAEIDPENHTLRTLVARGDEWGLKVGDQVLCSRTYCHRVLTGEFLAAINDTLEHPVTREMPMTRELGVRSYIGVPVVLADGTFYGTICCLSRTPNHDLDERDVRFMKVLGRLVARDIDSRKVVEGERAAAIRAAAVEALVVALEGRDNYTAEHSREVVGLAQETAERLGLDAEQIEEVAMVALLHDVGKVRVPDRVLNKPGPLDEAEWEAIRRHPVDGERIVRSVDSIARLAPAVRADHERWDGNGYPDGLFGEDIPIASRITLACDAFHAMISDRPYRRAIPRQAAIEELRRNAGTQFDPSVVEAVLRSLDSQTPSRFQTTRLR
ncbi:MAG: HD domain-containing protein [Actinomycetota bacterium]|nr:HD domain-containing protein [Actinomycetota bacterium]